MMIDLRETNKFAIGLRRTREEDMSLCDRRVGS